MSTAHSPGRSEGPFTYRRPGPSGYTTIHDRNGRMIGAATACAMPGATPLDDDTIAANGRLFAASHTILHAVSLYMDAADRGMRDGFDEDTLDELREANEAAQQGFAILFGKAGQS